MRITAWDARRFEPSEVTGKQSRVRSYTVTLTMLLPVVAFVIIAFGLRVDALDHTNMNWDEGYTNWIVHLPFGEMIETTARDVHPPLYYTLLRAASAFSGDSLFALRFLSVLLGTVGVALTFALGKLVGGYRVGLLAMLLLALVRSNIEISQLMRMHILATVFATGGLWATVRFWEHPRRRGAGVIYVLCVAGALYSFYLAVVLPVATNLAFLIVWWRRGRGRDFFLRWVGLQIAAAVLFLLWALYAVGLMHGWNAEQESAFGFFVQTYFVVLTAGVSAFWDSYVPWVVLFLLFTIAGTGWLFWQARQRGDDQTQEQVFLLYVAVLTPVLIVFLLTLPFHDLGRPLAARYLVLLSAAFYTLAALAVMVLARRHVALGVISALVILGIGTVGMVDTTTQNVRRDLYVSLATTLEAHRQPADAVVLYNDWAWTLFESVYDDEWVKVPYEADIDAAYANLILSTVWEDAPAVWVVEHPGALADDPDREIIRWLEERAVYSESMRFNENTLHVYVKDEARIATLDDVVSDVTIPDHAATASIGLRGAEPLLGRYPIGDSIITALYWSEPPMEPVTVTLQGTEATRMFEFEVPQVTQGITRQVVNLPLQVDLPAGRYRVVLTDPAAVELGEVTSVNMAPDVFVAETDVPHRLDVPIGEAITLVGYDLSDDTFTPGDRLAVELYWRTSEILDERYKVSVFALGDAFNPLTNNPLWGQVDSEPLNWNFPTTQWPPGEIIHDSYVFELDANTPAGEYDIGIVVYGLVDGARLPIAENESTLEDVATLETVMVE
jgi:4-amino-4-deoxy-L-arabinose transferase-like glycosyltransferase